MENKKQLQKERRQHRVRARISGTSTRPRLSLFRGVKHSSIQIIDDERGRTLASVSEHDLSEKERSMKKTERAALLGSLIAKRALEKGVHTVVFDRRSNKYHGRVQAAAQAAREGGLEF